MKKLLWLGIPALMLTASCVDNLDDDFNKNPKTATDVPGVSLVSNAERSLTRALVSTNVNLNPFRLWVQQWNETTYPDESRYDFVTRQINNAFWNTLYRDVLKDLDEGKRLISADPLIADDAKANQLAAIEVMEVYTWATLVDNFGDIPYSEALDFNNPRPKYDDDRAIYDDLVTRLNSAIGKFNEGAGSFDSGDLIYGGDVAKWMKFANSLKLRLALTYADVDAAKAASTISGVTVENVMTSNDDDADLVFDVTPPNTNPLWEDLVQSGRTDFIADGKFVTGLKTNNDPRLDEYFKPFNGDYTGGVAGAAHSFSYSKPGELLEDPSFPGTLMSYAQVEFMLAEAAARNLGGITGAADHYNAGITASILDWGNTPAEAAAYVAAHPYNAADFRKSIGEQLYIALYNQPVDNWREFRRLDFRVLPMPLTPYFDTMPLRYTYPIPEQNLNTNSYNAAKAAIGGDEIDNKIFWDK